MSFQFSFHGQSVWLTPTLFIFERIDAFLAKAPKSCQPEKGRPAARSQAANCIFPPERVIVGTAVRGYKRSRTINHRLERHLPCLFISRPALPCTEMTDMKKTLLPIAIICFLLVLAGSAQASMTI